MKNMKMLTKLLAGDRVRKTRLHDEKGNFVGFEKLFLRGPSALISGLLRICFDRRPTLPWISYSAILEIKEHLNPESRVLEFGSGMSTIWYSRHAGHVYSVEDSHEWFVKIEHAIKEKNISNVTYKFALETSEYTSFMADDMEGFDLVVVDGTFRSDCVRSAVKLLKSGGFLYLDNSDKDSSGNGGDMRIAEALVREFADATNSSVEVFTDFAPTQLFVQQGILLRRAI